MRTSGVPFIGINLYDLEVEQCEFLTILLLTLFGSLPRNESWDSERWKLLFTLNSKVSSDTRQLIGEKKKKKGRKVKDKPKNQHLGRLESAPS